ncbi:hypothetical protein ACS0TY_024792 [Phlomoides rotata]
MKVDVNESPKLKFIEISHSRLQSPAAATKAPTFTAAPLLALRPARICHHHTSPRHTLTAKARSRSSIPSPAALATRNDCIRSFRKNLANGSCSSKLASDSPEKSSPKPYVNCERSPFVKINMDVVPIGQKVDLKARINAVRMRTDLVCLSFILLAQSDSCVGGIKDKDDGGKEIGGFLDGSGEYTLVYEDNEGDRMLVGDVPWNMFVSTIKRLRVLKSSELPMLSREFFSVLFCYC